jgi:hypothetical protein
MVKLCFCFLSVIMVYGAGAHGAGDYLVIGDRKGDVWVNRHLTRIGDTIREKDVVKVGTKRGSAVRLVAADGRNMEFNAGSYNFSRLYEQVQSRTSKPWYANLWNFVIRRAMEHDVAEHTDATSGGIEKAGNLYFPGDRYLLLTDTIMFSWVNMGARREGHFILADTVQFFNDSTLYLNQVLDTTVNDNRLTVDLKKRSLRSNRVYYWCIYYGGGYQFQSLFYVSPDERKKVNEILSELNQQGPDGETAELKAIFTRSFFDRPF